MAVAQFVFSQQNQILETVDVELIDSAACRAWQYAVMLNKPVWQLMLRRGPASYREFEPVEAHQWLDEIHSCLQELEFTEFAFAEPVPQQPQQMDQALLNRLHRHFTTTHEFIWRPEFTDFETQDNIDKITGRLNIAIHKFESFVPTTQKLNYVNGGTEIICDTGRALGYDLAPHRHCHSFEHADLIMDAYILGKTLIESFVNDDDPVHWDTSGHVRTNGGCVFLMTNLRERIYQSAEFESWMHQHNTRHDRLYADMPLGMFAPGSRSRMEQLIAMSNFTQLDCKITIQL